VGENREPTDGTELKSRDSAQGCTEGIDGGELSPASDSLYPDPLLVGILSSPVAPEALLTNVLV